MSKNILPPIKTFFTVLLFVFTTSLVKAQNDEIIDAYEDYTDAAREIAYLHLNKSTYIKGEEIGFTAYVLDKATKTPSLLTTNLYVTIEDENKNTIKQQLIRVENGIASNTIEIDSSFSSGYYNIKAYTNWMRNFDEKNYFIESIQIIDFNNKSKTEKIGPETKIDAQFLPESGHLLNGVVNIIGVVIKDHTGYGMPNAIGEVVDFDNNIISTFKTNKFGIGKFQMVPEINSSYKVNIKNETENFTVNLNQKIEEQGIIISLKSLKSKAFVSLLTNDKTLNLIKNKRHTLLIHNGNNYDVLDIYFTDTTEISKAIDYNNTATGINILTLFNEEDQPIAERLFFNYEGINIIKTNTVSTQKTKDSIYLNLNFKNINTTNNISVSILPQQTKSYKSHNNIISYTFLEPYVNGSIEDAKYYFTDIDARKKYELDNLLITQGWSSYNWDHIFNFTSNQTFPFEQGITINANLTSKDLIENKDKNYIIHALQKDSPRFFNVKKEETSFKAEKLFPVETTLSISKVSKTNDLLPTSLYLQYQPNSIPSLNTNDKIIIGKNSENLSYNYISNSILSTDDNTQNLDEVLIKAKRNKYRDKKENLSKGRFGKVHLIDDEIRKTNPTLNNFLFSKGLNVVYKTPDGTDEPYGLIVTSMSDKVSMLIFLDDVALYDTSFLDRYDMSQIDYLEINKHGVGEGIRGAGGVIRIYSNNEIRKTRNNKTVQEFKLPLSFSSQKSYYIPKYKNTKDSFFESYGVIAWQPQLHIDDNGNISIKIAKPNTPISIHIEGFSGDGSFIVDSKTINLDE